MKKISEHLGKITIVFCCAVVIIGGVVAFRGPISDFFVFESVADKTSHDASEAQKNHTHTFVDEDYDIYCDICGYYNFADCVAMFPPESIDVDGDGFCDHCGNTSKHNLCRNTVA